MAILGKVLLIGDPHFHTFPQFGLTKDGKYYKRLKEQVLVWKQIDNLIQEEKVSRVIVAGDLFHKVGEIPIVALNLLNFFLLKWHKEGISLHIVAGNHDLVDRKTPEWFESAINLFSKEKDISNIKLINYNEEVDYKKTKGYDIVVLHKVPFGAKKGNYTFEEGVNWKVLAQNNKWVFFGHIHQRQHLSSNCIILGAPMHLDFGDVGDRGVYLLKEDNLEFIKLNYPEFITVNGVEETKEDGNYYRVLNAENKIEKENIVSIIKPKYFEEKLKIDTFEGILKKWLEINNKEENYLEIIKPFILEKKNLFKKIFKGKINKIKIDNFLSVEKIEYSVDKGFIYIKGMNGSGKSTLFEAIYWCLYGVTSKELTGDDVLRNRPELVKDCSVEIFLEGESGGQGLIRRSRKKGLEIYKNIQDIESIVDGMTQDKRQKILEESLLGISEDLYLSACYFSQENLQTITNMGNSDKTNLITNLLGFEQYDDLYNKCHEKQKEFEKEIQKLEITQTSLGFELQHNKLALETDYKEIKKYEESIMDNKKLLSDYQEKMKNLLFDVANPKLDFVVEKTKDYDDEIVKLEVVDIEIKNKLKAIEDKKFDLTVFLTNSIQKEIRLKKDIEDTERNIRKIDEGFNNLEIGTQCDVCGSVITEETRDKYNLERKKEQEVLNLKLVGLKKDLEEISKEILEKKKEGETNLEERKKFEIEIEEIRKEVKRLSNKKFEQSEQQRKLDNYRNTLALEQKMYQTRIEECQKNIEEREKAKLGYQKEVLLRKNKIVEQENKLKEIVWAIDKIKKGIFVLEFWKEAFSSRGIRSLLLSNFCNEFNSIVNRHISLISNGEMQLLLNPEKELKSGEKRNELELDIIFKGNICKYNSLSGGERRRVDISLCLALNQWVSIKYSLKSGLLGILILDEIFSFIDNEGEENIANLLREEGENKAIFVIAHSDSIRAFAPKEWEVVKINDITYLSKQGEL